MEQMFWLLFVGLLGGFWLSLEEANCQELDKGMYKIPQCYYTSSGKTCFTTFLANSGHLARRSFNEARNWCNSTVPGSSLIIINSLESQRTVESLIGIQRLVNETIIIDAQKLSSRDRTEWSWVNGNATIPENVSAEQLPDLDGACVESKHGQSLIYCTGTYKAQYRYICEYSESKSASFSYRQNNKSYYVANEGSATWYDARNECLRLGGDLASITDLQTILNWSWLTINQKYWIGLRRNKWIWNSTGAALTYTNWEGGSPEESSADNQCICINPPQCNQTTCEVDRKWRTCNCNHNYAIVCQKKEKSDALTTKSVATELPSAITTRRHSANRSTPLAIATTTFNKTTIAPTPVTPTTTASTPPLKPGISTVTTYTTVNALTQEPSNHFSDDQTTAFASSPAGLFNSFGTKEILLILVLFVAVVLIIVAVIFIIRKRRYGRQNEISPTKNTAQSETVSPVYATVVPDNNRPSEGTVPPGNPIYAEVEMTKQPTPPSSNTIYASVQPTSEAADKGKSVVYADLDFPQKDQQKPRSADKITASLSSSYSQPYKPPTSANNTDYTESTYLESIDVDPRATQESQDPSAVYAEPMKLTKSS